MNLPLERWKSIFLKKSQSQFSPHVYDYEHANVCWLHLVYISIIWFYHIQLEKSYLVAWRTVEVLSQVTIVWPYVITEFFFFIVINSVDTTLPTFCHWKHSMYETYVKFWFFKHTLILIKLLDYNRSSILYAFLTVWLCDRYIILHQYFIALICCRIINEKRPVSPYIAGVGVSFLTPRVDLINVRRIF